LSPCHHATCSFYVVSHKHVLIFPAAQYHKHATYSESTQKHNTMEKEHRRNPIHPSPKPKVLAGEEPVKTPTRNDVLSGRGGGVNSHPGNKRYRALVNSMKVEYLNPKTRKAQKTHIAANVVWAIRQCDPPGRFLKVDKSTGMWYEIGDQAAFRKTGQALRENSFEYRTCWKRALEGPSAPAGTCSSPSSTSSEEEDSVSTPKDDKKNSGLAMK